MTLQRVRAGMAFVFCVLALGPWSVTGSHGLAITIGGHVLMAAAAVSAFAYWNANDR